MSRMINRLYGRVYGWFDSKDAEVLGRRLPTKYSSRRALLALNNLEDRAVPATFTVNVLTDAGALTTGVGSGTTGDLRYCIIQATANAEDDIINFSIPGGAQTLSLAGFQAGTHALFLGTNSTASADAKGITINGPTGAGNSLTVNWGGSGTVSRSIFSLNPATGSQGTGTPEFTINNLSITGGSSTNTGTGGAISMGGQKLTLNSTTIFSNTVSATSSAGAVYVNSTSGVLVVDNGSVIGGTVAGTGNIQKSTSTTGSNSAGIGGNGTFTVNNSTLGFNSTGGRGGAISTISSTLPVVVTNTTLRNNTAGGGGGALHMGAAAPLNVTGSKFTANTSTGMGGAIRIASSSAVSIDDSTFTGNDASTYGGALGFFSGGTLVLNRSTLNSNVSRISASTYGGGALYLFSPSSVTISSSTLYRNSTTSRGGAILFAGTASGSVNINNSTIVENSAVGSASASGGGIAGSTSTTAVPLNLSSTIVAGNTAQVSGKDIFNNSMTVNASYSAFSSGYIPSNSDPNSKTFALYSDMGLDTINGLVNNGGTTQTITLVASSPLRDRGENASGYATDQRGQPRDQSQPGGSAAVQGVADIGAVEAGLAPVVTAVLSSNVSPIVSGTGEYTFTVTYTDANSNPIDLATVGNLPNDDVLIDRIGGGFTSFYASFVSVDSSNPSAVVATYKITPASFGGSFDGIDNGTYTYTVPANTVKNSSNVGVFSSGIGSFTISLPATYTVNVATDTAPGTGGVGSGFSGDLRYVLSKANASVGAADTIVFDPTVFSTNQTITLGATLSITDPVAINGPGASKLTITGTSALRLLNTSVAPTAAEILIKDVTLKAVGTVSGNGGIVTIGDEAVEFRDAVLSNTTSTLDGGAIFVSGNAGAGISTLKLTRVTMANNKSGDDGGAIATGSGASPQIDIIDSTLSGNVAVGSGGAFYNFSGGVVLNISGTTMSSNTANASPGGGAVYLYTTSTLPTISNISNSTFYGNKAVGTSTNGGAIQLASGGAGSTFTLTNSTLTGNSSGGTGTSAGYGGGGISQNVTTGWTITITSSIISGNSAAQSARADISLFSAPTIEYSAIEFGQVGGAEYVAGGTSLTNANSSALLVFGTSTPVPGNNGGATQTIAIPNNSTAINTGSNTLALAYDQRGVGYDRISGSSADIGAFERVAGVPGVSSASLPTITGGSAFYTFTVTYSDDTAINGSTVGNQPDDDLVISKIGGGFTPVNAIFVSKDVTNPAAVTATYKFAPIGGLWDSTDNGSYEIRTLLNGVKSSAGVAVPAGSLAGTITVNAQAPTATLGSALNVTSTTTGDYSFTVVYSDANAIAVNTIQNKTGLVTVEGPNSFNATINTATVDTNTDGTPRTVTYTFTPPGGGFDVLENGTYTIKTAGGTVTNVSPGTVFIPAALTLGTFKVAIPVSYFVTNTDDSGAGSLRQAITDANADTSNTGIIEFSSLFNSSQTIVLATALPAISDGLVINGKGASLLTISGNNAVGVFNTGAAATGAIVEFRNLTVTNSLGSALITGDESVTLRNVAITNGSTSGQGGAINANNTALTLIDSTLSGNKASGVYGGGGIYFTGGTLGSLTIQGSTISGNSSNGNSTSFDGGGGGVYLWSTAIPVTITNSTIANNTTQGEGGGLQFNNASTVTISNSTIVNNTANEFSGGVSSRDGGTLNLSSTLVTGNLFAGSDADFANTGTVNANKSAWTTVPENLSGTSADNLTDTLVNFKLLPLGSNGGATQTMGLDKGSPLIGAGQNTLGLLYDQRGVGYDRLSGAGVDIGSFERVVGVPTAATGPLAPIAGGSAFYTFTVTYSDDTAMNITTIGNQPDDDLVISKVGGGFTPVNAIFVSMNSSDPSAVTATYKFAPIGGLFDSTDNGTYEIRVLPDGVKSSSNVSVPANSLAGTFQISAQGPTATLGTAAKVTAATVGDYSFTVVYSDANAIAVNTIQNKTGVVEVTGPNSFTATINSATVDTNTDGTPRTVTYTFTPTGGGFDSSENGVYTIKTAGGTVTNASPGTVFIASGLTIGTFQVAIPAVYTVNATTDSGTADPMDVNKGDLRYLISKANADDSPSTIIFDSTVFASSKTDAERTITLTSALPALTAGIDIQGPTATGTGAAIIDGAGLTRHFDTSTAAATEFFTISDLTLTNGSASGTLDGGSINIGDETVLIDRVRLLNNVTSNEGGAIKVSGAGKLTIRQSTISGNSANGAYGGGGIYVTGTTGGTLDIQSSTISGNFAAATTTSYYFPNAGGGALYIWSGSINVTISNSTIANNTSGKVGGAFSFDNASNLTLINTTVVGNSAALAGGIYLDSGVLTMNNSVVAGNGTDIDVLTLNADYSAWETSNATPTGANNIVDTPANLGIGTLGSYGGPTQTVELLAGGLLINAGPVTSSELYDQRGVGFARVVGAAADIGAFEVQGAAPAFPAVSSISVNQGAVGGSTQRSRITSITVTFAANLTAGNITTLQTTDVIKLINSESGAGTAVVRTGGAGTVLDGTVTVTATPGTNTAVLTFAGTAPAGPNDPRAVDFGSLSDGRWRLEIDSTPGGTPEYVSDGSVPAQRIRRLFGDINGDGTVDGGTDSASFAIGNFQNVIGLPSGTTTAAFDFNNDGTIDGGTDFAEFGSRFGRTV